MLQPPVYEERARRPSLELLIYSELDDLAEMLAELFRTSFGSA